MAAMAGIPFAQSIEGKLIFKGRCHALVPIRHVGESVQWHMLDTYPIELDFDRIFRDCPSILEGHIGQFNERRAFVGWCSEVQEVIGVFFLGF